uniref:Cytochrome c oxidase subunit 5A, mitochondrial n=1 Tax=Strigamia maritima TaxID=126957 RepID=T1II41_STRMM
MFRLVSSRLHSAVRTSLLNQEKTVLASAQQCMRKHGVTETDEAFDARYEAYFNRDDIDHWEIRKAMNDLQGMDLVPEPKIMIAALKACRRLNDFALAVRFLEAVKHKCGSQVKEIYPYLIGEIKPTLDELGISTPEKMGYDKPELALQSVYDIHG